jgi:hypothetical protein
MRVEYEVKEEGFKRTDHFYGLAGDGVTIIKFDTVVEQAGLFWRCPREFKIQEMWTSRSRQMLMVVLVHDCPVSACIEGDDNKVVAYQVLRLDSGGCVLERSTHAIHTSGLGLDFLQHIANGHIAKRLLQLSRPLQPWWIRCFTWEDRLYFLSLKTGRILHSLRLSASPSLLAVGPSNSLLLANSLEASLIVSLLRCRAQESPKRCRRFHCSAGGGRVCGTECCNVSVGCRVFPRIC